MANKHTPNCGEEACSPEDMKPVSDSQTTPVEPTIHVCPQTQGQTLGNIMYRLPSKGAVCGSVYRHFCRVVEGLISKHGPITFKTGITHDAIWRWTNRPPGYQQPSEKFSHMVVCYISNEPHSGAMPEAAPIDKYQCF